MRLAAGARVSRRVGGPLVGIVVVWLVWWGGLLVGDDAGYAAADRYGFPGLVCFLAVGVWALDVVVDRADAGIVAALPRRVVRDARAPVTVVLGRFVTWWAVAAAGTAVGFSLVVLLLDPGWSSLLRVLAVLLASAQEGARVAGQVRREAVALDGPSLAIDERLRTQRARQGLAMLPAALWVALPHDRQLYPGLPGGLVLAGFATAAVLLLINAVLIAPRAWEVPAGLGWASPTRVLPGPGHPDQT